MSTNSTKWFFLYNIGLEPITYGLKVHHSTNWVNWKKNIILFLKSNNGFEPLSKDLQSAILTNYTSRNLFFLLWGFKKIYLH